MSSDPIRQYQCAPTSTAAMTPVSGTSALPASPAGKIGFDEGVYIEGLTRCPSQYHWIGTSGFRMGGSAVTEHHVAVAVPADNLAISDTSTVEVERPTSTPEVEHALARLLRLARLLWPDQTYGDIKDAVADYASQRKEALAAGDHRKARQLLGLCIARVVISPVIPGRDFDFAAFIKMIDFLVRVDRLIGVIRKVIRWMFW